MFLINSNKNYFSLDGYARIHSFFSLALVQRQAEIDNISKWKGNQDNFQQGQLFMIWICNEAMNIKFY